MLHAVCKLDLSNEAQTLLRTRRQNRLKNPLKKAILNLLPHNLLQGKNRTIYLQGLEQHNAEFIELKVANGEVYAVQKEYLRP